jgi:penicillin amidase
MPRSLARAAAAGALLVVVAGCRGEPPARPPEAPPLLPPPSGTIVVGGVREPVTVIRDAAGIPHINATNEDDLFFAQGFVQAQDRLFQMDLWRRSVQGRLSEVLGANFIERDAMTRRVQYRGPMASEWESYGPRTKEIAEAFTRGINAWIERVQDELPKEFALAGWKPELWKPEDLLNRTDAFLASGDAQDEVLRARLIAAIGVATTDAIWPRFDRGPTRPPAGVDLGAVNYTLSDLLRRVGTPPFFSALLAPVGGTGASGPGVATPGSASNVWAVAGSRAAGRALVAADPHRALATPSLRYLVHLRAPGYNAIGATAPWLPGVAIGHNDIFAWAYGAAPVDVQDLYVEKLNPANEHQVQFQGRWVDVEVEHGAIAVKGRREPFEYDRLYTRHGVVIGLDRERHLAYTLRWSGTEPGTAGELAAAGLGRASTVGDLRAALTRWKMPPADFVVANQAGLVGTTRAALVSHRAPGAGLVPTPGWMDSAGWHGWEPRFGPELRTGLNGFAAFSNGNFARLGRIENVLATLKAFDVASMTALQRDVVAVNAERFVPLLAGLDLRVAGPQSEALSRARADLMNWDRRMSAGSPAAALYSHWEAALRRLLVERRVPGPLRAEFMIRPWWILPDLTYPTTRSWFDGDPAAARDKLLIDALSAAVQERASAGADTSWGAEHQVLFAHPLAVTDAARKRFNVGPFTVSGYADTVFATTATTGPALRIVMDTGDWDRSVAINAPGQSESPRSVHFRDMADKWAAGEYVPLLFAEEAIRANAAASLTLTPPK